MVSRISQTSVLLQQGVCHDPNKTPLNMIQSTSPLTIGICAAMACATFTRGAVTYVDASVNNTVGAASGLVDWNNGSDATSTSGTVTTNDSLWRYRTSLGNTGIWEATSSSTTPEDAVQLLTTVPVPNGTYQVYVFFLAAEAGAEDPVGGGVDNDFPIRAGHLAATLELFDQLGSASGSTYTGYEVGTAGKNALSGVDALAFTSTPTPTLTGGRTLLYGRLSTTQVVTDGTLRVYIDDFPALGTSNSADARTWYDGVGYELIPEPSAALLGGLGLLALLRRRRVG